jgi:tryptophan synthase alpha chain
MTGAAILARAFAACEAGERAALIPFLPLGDPDFATTLALARAAAAAGADIIELGVPFSDPLADGPVIQAAYARALAAGATPEVCLACAGQVARETGKPIVLMTAWNLVLARGPARFCAEAAALGVSGLLVPDLLVEDAGEITGHAHDAGLATVFLAAPDTPLSRLRLIAAACTGFVYLVLRRGVTGAGAAEGSLAERVRLVRAHSSVPVACGFGVESPEAAREIARLADGVIVGSSLLAGIAASRDPVAALASGVRRLAEAVQRQPSGTAAQ